MTEKGTVYNFHCTQSLPIVWLFQICPGAKCSALREIINDDVSSTKVFVSSTTYLTDTDNFCLLYFNVTMTHPVLIGCRLNEWRVVFL